MLTIENAVGGKRYVSSSTRRVPVFNPATGEQSAELPLSTLDELNAAVSFSGGGMLASYTVHPPGAGSTPVTVYP